MLHEIENGMQTRNDNVHEHHDCHKAQSVFIIINRTELFQCS